MLNLGLKFISVDDKVVRMILETSASNINEIVLMPAVKIVMKKLVKRLQNKIVHGRVYNGTLNGIKVSIIRSQVGCPNAALTIECLKRSKAKIVVRVDFCGGIYGENTTINIGDIVIPKSAYCGDGTSSEYLRANQTLLNQLESTLNSINIKGIDMESSILFLLGQLYNLKVASILSVSDLPGDAKYDLLKSNEIHPDMETGIDNAIKILINTLPKIQHSL